MRIGGMDPRQLREQTRAEHEATEALMPLTAAGLTRDTYGGVLLTLEPLVRGWEAWAAGAAPAGLREMVQARRRGAMLRADLAFFGMDWRPAVPEVNWAEVVGGPEEHGQERGEREAARFEAAFLGALYVMDGSTLGGRLIARHVEAVLGLAPGDGDAYFRGHGEATGTLWREVTGRIAEVPDALGPTVIQAAKRTFAAFGNALRAGLPACDGARA